MVNISIVKFALINFFKQTCVEDDLKRVLIKKIETRKLFFI